MLTLFKAIESVKMGLKRMKKKIGVEKIGPRLGKKIDRLEVYTSPGGVWVIEATFSIQLWPSVAEADGSPISCIKFTLTQYFLTAILISFPIFWQIISTILPKL